MEQFLQQAVSILQEGGVVVYPTDTVYGLGADAFNEKASARIYRIKQRPLTRPFPLLIADESELADLATGISETAKNMMDHFWPGGLTLVVRKSPSLPDWLTAGGNTIAVRIPDHPLALALIRGLCSPLIGTSANLSGLPSVASAEEVRAQLGGEVDFVLDGGICPGGIESTVIDVTGEVPTIIREGAVSGDEIARLCGPCIRQIEVTESGN
ncbi:MAG: threonylcarbamoyl-AMP synthase [Chloroflexi bacterium]|jgi:L-threonylcarbamoyladenylate synthase|nr:threonylcarbamoyl-AMP synthase [Chloroflexota bacterium]